MIYDSPHHVRQYLTYMDKYISDHDLLRRSQLLLQDPRNDEAAIAFDKDFTIGLLAGEQACKRHNRSPWSQSLHEAKTTKYILS